MTEEELNMLLLQPDAYHQTIKEDECAAYNIFTEEEANIIPYPIQIEIERIKRKYHKDGIEDTIPPFRFLEIEDSTKDFIICRDGQMFAITMNCRVQSYGKANGYPRVKLRFATGVERFYYKHRLLGLAYRPYIHDSQPDVPFDELVVNHIDGIKDHCYVTDLDGKFNIEVVTQAENTQHAYDTGLIKKKTPKPKGRYNSGVPNIRVGKVDKDTNEVLQIYRSIGEAARQNDIPQPLISRTLNNPETHKTAGGFKWIRVSDLKKIYKH